GAAVHFGFEILGLHRIELYASPGNHASHRIAEKIGFRKEGYLRDSAMGRDGFLDSESYGLLETDARWVPEPISFQKQD
ncbi:MAG: GNAT family N-acetyltransferase, partial [Actinomycetota bacterium]